MASEVRKSGVTLVDVANKAGVSRATASLVVRGSDLISAKTTKRVLRAMKELGYVYNRAAASLRSKSSHTVGIVVTDITNPFFAELTLGVQHVIDESGLSLLLANSAEDKHKQTLILENLYENRVDGILICPAKGSDRQFEDRMRSRNIPIGLIARSIHGTDIDYTGADNRLGAQLATEHLISLGHRLIAFAGGPDDSSARKERFSGFRDIMTLHGLPIDERFSISTDVTRAGGYQAAISLLGSRRKPTAVLCYNDIVAFGVMVGLRDGGLKPGADFSVVGFDDVAEAGNCRPALTTISVPPGTIGGAAATRLLRRISSPSIAVKRTYITPTLVVRESTQRLKKRKDHEKD